MLPILTVGQPLPEAPDALVRSYLRVSDSGDGYSSATAPDGSQVLWPHPSESENVGAYPRRQRQARCPKLVSQAIDDFLAMLWVHPVERSEGPEIYDALLEDADGTGSPLDNVIDEAARNALVEGWSWLWVDTLPDQSRAVIRPVVASQVPIFRVYRGDAQYAAVVAETADGVPFVYAADAKQSQRWPLKKLEGGQLVVEPPEPAIAHGFGGCPFVYVSPFSAPFSRALADSQRDLLNFRSLETEEITSQVFSLLAFIGMEEAPKALITIGSQTAVLISNPNAKVERIGATNARAEIHDREQAELSEFYRLARLSPGNPLTSGGTAESGVSRALRMFQLTKSLGKLARCLQRAENVATNRWASASNSAEPAPASYPTSFDVPDLQGDVDLAQSVLNLPDVTPTLKKNALRLVADRAFPSMSPEERNDFDSELDGLADKPDPSLYTDPGQGHGFPGKG